MAYVDFPDPSTPGLGRLFSVEFYRLLAGRLSAQGAFTVQATSPYYTREAFWCIERTVAEAGFATRPYHAWVPSFGEWGFVLAGRSLPSEAPRIADVPLTFLTPEIERGLFVFPADMGRVAVEPNTLFAPSLYQYYSEAIRRED